MTPTIKKIPSKKLIGKRVHMSHVNDRTMELFKSFMPQKKEIDSKVNNDVLCMKVYGPSHDFDSFDPRVPFDKWAAVEVTETDQIPEGMETFTLPGGMYAVFNYKGNSNDPSAFYFIFGTWLPTNGAYELDHRPHFEVLGERYKNNDPESEEEIWVPVKKIR